MWQVYYIANILILCVVGPIYITNISYIIDLFIPCVTDPACITNAPSSIVVIKSPKFFLKTK